MAYANNLKEHNMDSDVPVQTTAYEQVRRLLTQLYGESARADDHGPVFWLAYGSTEVAIRVEALDGDRVYVRIFSWVVTEPRVDDELRGFLVTANGRMRLGAFALDDAGDVQFAYGLLDREISASALRDAVRAVMQTADEYDDIIVERFGGLRVCDRLRAMTAPADFDRALDEAGLRPSAPDDPDR